MPEYKPEEANEMSWSDDYGWIEKKNNPRYTPADQSDKEGNRSNYIRPTGPSSREYTDATAGDIVWSDDYGWCRKDEHPLYSRFKRGE